MTGKSVNQEAKVGQNVPVGGNERERNRQRIKPQKSRMLYDIYGDPAYELRERSDITNTENVNRILVNIVVDDESDDENVTLAEYFRQQKGVEITGSTSKKKKKHITRNDSNADPSRQKTEIGEMDAQTMAIYEEDSQLQCNKNFNRFTEVSYTKASKKEIEDFESEVAKLLASRFDEDEQIVHEHTIQIRDKTVAKTSSKTSPTKKKVVYDKTHKKIIAELLNCGTLVCLVNRNPADISLADAESKFLRGG